ncbi:hypothetical protein [Anaerorhabdus sp.]|uniref:hypothetical protein n=1 Tax=Anaerorhabdus sp. TaxID=1872524 RepID=UPI002FC73D76
MSKKGFISAIFLWYLLLVITLLGYIESQFQAKIQVYLNVKEANSILDLEVKIIDWLICEMKNNRLKDGGYELSGISFEVMIDADLINIDVYQEKILHFEYEKDLFSAVDECESQVEKIE